MTEKLWTNNLILLVLANAFARCSFDILLPTLPIFLIAHGNNGSQVGIIMGLFTLSAILIRFFSAKGSRQFGTKRFLYLGIIICSVASAAYNIGTTFATAITIRMIHGFGFGITTTLMAAIASGAIPASRRGEGFGYLGFGALITAAIAPFLGLWLLDNLGSTYLFGVTALTQLCILACILPVSLHQLPSGKQAPKQPASPHPLLEKSALLPCFLTLLLGICLSSVMCFIALFGKEINISNIGWFFLANTLGAFFVRLIAGRIFDCYGRSWVIIPGILLALAGLILISQATSIYSLIVAAILYGLGAGAVFPALQAWIVSRATPGRYNEANAMFYNAFDIGIGGGAILLGFIVTATSYSIMYLWAAFVMAILLAVYIISQVFDPKKVNRVKSA